MSLIQTLLVRNGADLVVDNIQFHLEAGVDHIVLTDHRSTDGLRDLLCGFIDQGVLSYLYQDSEMFDQSAWVTHMSDIAFHKLGADWIINSDVDEFWVAKSGARLDQVFAQQTAANVLVAQRHDFACLEAAKEPFWQDMIYRYADSKNCEGKSLPPKVAHRGAAGLVVTAGNHNVLGFENKRVQRDIIEVLHFPMRNKQQYTDKIAFGGAALNLTKHIKQGVGGTWRKQLAELRETGDIQFLRDNIFTDEQIHAGVKSGVFVKDTRVRCEMQRICTNNRDDRSLINNLRGLLARPFRRRGEVY